MARDSSGNYSLPTGNPVVTGTTITSTWANDTMTDLGTEMTDSLNRSGKGPMLAALNIVDGTVSAPGLRFNDESTSGIYRSGAGKIDFSITNSQVLSVQDAKLVWTAQSNAFDIVGAATTDLLTISGSSATTTGANLLLYGSTHATLAGDFKLRNGTTDIIHYDLSATTLTLAATTLATSGAYTHTGALTVTSTLDVQGAFTSLGIDDNASALRLVVGDTGIYIGGSGATGDFTLGKRTADSVFRISGGSTGALGGQIRLYGESHASRAGDIYFYEDTTVVGSIINTAWSTNGGALTCGTFTSTGIDDNATGERFQLGDTSVHFGTAGAAWNILHIANDQSLTLSGSSGVSSGATVTLYGPSHATRAEDIRIASGGADRMTYDASAATWTIDATGGITTDDPFTCGTFTSTGIDDNATGERLQIADLAMDLGTAGAQYDIEHAADDQYITLSGGNNSNSGANLGLYGGTHATRANDFLIRASATAVIDYDHSATTLTLTADTIDLVGATSADTVTLDKARFADGTEAAPSITFDSDADTGLFRPGANTIGFTVAGGAGGGEAMRLTSGGNLLIGTTTDSGNALTVLGEAQVADAAVDATLDDTFQIVTNGTDHLVMYDYSGASAHPVPVGEDCGRILFRGARNALRHPLASIAAIGQGNSWSSATLNNAPSALGFYTQDSTSTDVTAPSASNAPRMMLTSTGKLLIGTTSEPASGDECIHVQSGTDFGGTLPTGSALILNDNGGVRMHLLSSNTATSYIMFGDTDNGESCFISNNHSDNSMTFRTAGTDRVKINANTLEVLVSGGGVKLDNLASSDANTLDDYEEGTWTPVPADAASAGNAGTASTALGAYTKVGDIVTVECTLNDIDTTGMTAGNDFYIRGLPFASASGTRLAIGSCNASSITFADYLNVLANGAAAVRLAESASATGLDYVIVSQVTSGAGDVRFTMTYKV